MKVTSIAVLGAGIMGSGIAQTLATHGFQVCCFDISETQLDRARHEVEHGRYGLARAVSRGKVSAEDAAAALTRLSFTDSLGQAVTDVQMVVEAVVEDLEVKVRLFRELDRMTPRETILASNTSGYTIGALAGSTERPDRVIGWHWASPPPVRPLAEIVVTPTTSVDTTDAVVAAAGRCGKNPVVVKDHQRVWGTPSTRLFVAMLNEAERVVDEGTATPEQVDQLMVDCFGWPAGPFAITGGSMKGWQDR